MRRSLLLTALLTLTAPSASANDGVFGGTGVHPVPVGSDAVTMADEIVTLRLDPERDAWNVHCSFIFENTTDEAVTLTIGFPFPTAEGAEVAGPAGTKAPREGQPMVWDFTTTVRGKKVHARRGAVGHNPERPGLDYDFAYLWDVTFAPHERVHIVNTYRHGVTASRGGYVFANYVIRTGTTWKGGHIGHARFSVQVPTDGWVPCRHPNDRPNAFAKPAGAVVSPLHGGPGLEVHWSLADLAPESELEVCFIDLEAYRFDHFIDAFAGASLAGKSAEELRMMRNTVYALNGYVFKDPALRAHFAAQWWYRPDPSFDPQKDLREIERTFVRDVRAAERALK